jgi:hypothetical protein
MFIGRGHACVSDLAGARDEGPQAHGPRNDMWDDDGGNTST